MGYECLRSLPTSSLHSSTSIGRANKKKNNKCFVLQWPQPWRFGATWKFLLSIKTHSVRKAIEQHCSLTQIYDKNSILEKRVGKYLMKHLPVFLS